MWLGCLLPPQDLILSKQWWLIFQIPCVVILPTNRKGLQRFAGKFTASISDLSGLYGSLWISASRVIHLLFSSALSWWYDKLSSDVDYVFHLLLTTLSELDVFRLSLLPFELLESTHSLSSSLELCYWKPSVLDTWE